MLWGLGSTRTPSTLATSLSSFAETPGPITVIKRPGALFTPRQRPLYLDDVSWQVAYVLSVEPLMEQKSKVRDLIGALMSIVI